MKKWNERTQEVAFLLNPAFCGRLLYTTIKAYIENAQQALPFPLIYLVLPLVLHKSTRERINSRTKLLVWIQRNPELLIDFSKRAHDLVLITNESLEFLFQTGNIQLTTNGALSIVNTKKALSKTKFVDCEIIECINKSEHMAKWFASTGKTVTIYVSLGVRP